MSSKDSETSERSRSLPAGSRIVLVEETPRRLLIQIPPGGEHAARLWWAGVFLLPALLYRVWQLWFATVPQRPLRPPMQLAILALTAAAAFLCFWGPYQMARAKFERMTLLVEEGHFAIQRILLGWRRIEQVTLRSGSRAAIIDSFKGNRYPPRVIVVLGEESCLQFGRMLSDEEQLWVASRINCFLQATDFHRDGLDG